MSFTILIAPSGFKESLTASEAAAHIANGIRRADPDATVLEAPMMDGGEGFVEAMLDAVGGTLHRVTVTGPVGAPVDAAIGLLAGQREPTAVIALADAAGLRHVPRDRRNPCLTTSYGVGELVGAALDLGARRIVLGCGDSGINDGGAGMAQALGIRFLDRDGNDLAQGGAALACLARIDVSGRDPRLDAVRIDAAVNWHNLLTGPKGVARVFGPQKGATPEQVEILDAAMSRLPAAIAATTGIAVARGPGAGASGGVGAAIMGLLGGRLHPRFDLIMKHLDLDRLIDRCDLVVTAEGSLDGQTPFGKVPAEVARRAKRRGLPVIAIAGTIGTDAVLNLRHGIDAFVGMLDRPCTLDEAVCDAGRLLEDAAEGVMRIVSVGRCLGSPHRGRRRAARQGKGRCPAMLSPQ